jgi:hypothetical protein
MRTSHWVANSAPIPTAGPSTAAITGLGQATMGQGTRNGPASAPSASSPPVRSPRPRLARWSFLGRVGEVGQVGACAERAAGPGHHHGVHGVVRSGLPDRGLELVQDREGHRVALLGPVDRDRRDPVTDLVADVAHAGRVTRESTRVSSS